jgi:non-heme chloroperoxidase
VACITTWQTDFRDDLPKIDVPVLVVQGDADRILPYPNTGKRLPGLIKDMRLVVIDGGPHAIAWTECRLRSAVMRAGARCCWAPAVG